MQLILKRCSGLALRPNLSVKEDLRGLGTFKILTQQVMNGLGWAVPVQNFPRPIIE